MRRPLPLPLRAWAEATVLSALADAVTPFAGAMIANPLVHMFAAGTKS